MVHFLPTFLTFQKLNQFQLSWYRWEAPVEWNITIYFFVKKEVSEIVKIQDEIFKFSIFYLNVLLRYAFLVSKSFNSFW